MNYELFIRRVCDVIGKDYDVVVSKSRKAEISFLRHMLVWYLCNNTDMTYREIGEHFGGRDHSTVINSKRVAGDILDMPFDKYYKTANFYQNICENIHTTMLRECEQEALLMKKHQFKYLDGLLVFN